MLTDRIIQALSDPIIGFPIEVRRDVIMGEHYGDCRQIGTNPRLDAAINGGLSHAGEARWLIRLNALKTDEDQLATLAHELAHIYCGHVGESETGEWSDRSRLHPIAKEMEAEMATVVFLHTANMPSPPDKLLYRLGQESDRQGRLPRRQTDGDIVSWAFAHIRRQAGLEPASLRDCTLTRRKQ